MQQSPSEAPFAAPSASDADVPAPPPVMSEPAPAPAIVAETDTVAEAGVADDVFEEEFESGLSKLRAAIGIAPRRLIRPGPC